MMTDDKQKTKLVGPNLGPLRFPITIIVTTNYDNINSAQTKPVSLRFKQRSELLSQELEALLVDRRLHRLETFNGGAYFMGYPCTP
jgi:CO dehydrogenase/acetyl-CoA synthase beta subunit